MEKPDPGRSPDGKAQAPVARFQAHLDALAPDGRIGLAVSGGPDSLALLLLAHHARPDAIAAATVDHGLRTEAAAEAAMVAAICATLNVPHATLTVHVADDPDGLQAAARKARYRALGDWAVSERLPWLATAHHADDQAETLLMRLARGAGLGGLAGVRQARPLPDAPGVTLVRPLLDWRKTELEAVVAAAGLVPVRDPSNRDGRFDRTHARILLANGWPDAVRVAAAARHLADAEAALAWAAIQAADARLRFTDDGVEIDVADLPRELRRRLLLAAFVQLGAMTVPRGDKVERLLGVLDHGRAATLAGWHCDPGPPWRLRKAPPRRSG